MANGSSSIVAAVFYKYLVMDMFSENINAIKRASDYLSRNVGDLADGKDFKLQFLSVVFSYMAGNPKEWDECVFNVKFMGERLIRFVNEYNADSLGSLDLFCSCVYRFLCELEFNISNDKSLNSDLVMVKELLIENIDAFEPKSKSQIIYASYVMASNICSYVFNKSGVGTVVDLDRKVSAAVQKLDLAEKGYLDKELEVRRLEESLDKYKDAYNFVGLNAAFSNMATKKKVDLNWNRFFLFGLGLSVFFTPILSLILQGEGVMSIAEWHHYLPLVTLEVVLVYFFRVALYENRSIKTLLVQLDLRMALCQFVQSYADYAVEIKKVDANVLDKFEGLVFGGLVVNSDALPGTFDGLDQISNVIKSIKSK